MKSHPRSSLTSAALLIGSFLAAATANAGGVEFIQLQGKWKRSPMPQQDMIDAAREKLKTHPDSCTTAGQRTEDGQSVMVYQVRSKELGTQLEVSILQSSGLLQGSRVKLPNGTTITTRYEYANVRAPKGVP